MRGSVKAQAAEEEGHQFRPKFSLPVDSEHKASSKMLQHWGQLR